MDQKNASRNAMESVSKIFGAYTYMDINPKGITLDFRIYQALKTVKMNYYPVIAIVALPMNVVTIFILSRGKCGLSKGVTMYLVAMVAADQLVVLFDVVLNKIPISYMPIEVFLWSQDTRVCNIHAVVLYTVTDCSLWFTVTFTFDRLVAICFQKLKRKYCTERAAALVLGTVILMSCLKNIFWYFVLNGLYSMSLSFMLCLRSFRFPQSQETTFLLIHSLLTPIFPFVLILLLNSLTIRHVLVVSRARRNLRGSCDGETPADPEMKNRRQSLLLLFLISGNFVLLWALLTVYSLWDSVNIYIVTSPPNSPREVGYMLQLLSCCTNTALYAVAQTRFRVLFKETVKSPFRLMTKYAQRCQESINSQ